MSTDLAIRISNCSYSYQRATHESLRDIELQVRRGEVVGILGATGAGKTTLMRTLNGLIPHFFEGEIKGDVFIEGVRTLEHKTQFLIQKVGLVFDDALRAVELAEYVDRSTEFLSGGEKQRVAIAGVLALGPQILALDEPTASLAQAARHSADRAGPAADTGVNYGSPAGAAGEHPTAARIGTGGVPGETQPGRPVIEIEDLHFSYLKGQEVLRGIDLVVYERDFVRLVGQNGAGKSTLSKTLNRLLEPGSGTVKINRIDVRERSTSELARNIGYVFQNPDHQIFSSSIWEEIEFGLINTGIKENERMNRITRVLETVGLDKPLDTHPLNLGRGERLRDYVALLIFLALLALGIWFRCLRVGVL